MERICRNCVHFDTSNIDADLLRDGYVWCVRYPQKLQKDSLDRCGEYLPSQQVTENANRLIAERLENDRTKTLPQKGD